MKQFINDRDSVVSHAIDGLIWASVGHQARLDGYPHIKVVVRTDWDKSRVALISGGGSGHEPSHAGFVGEGMLTAAICGDVFASPSVDAVLAGIVAVTGEAGCLLIVKNYTGDRLNFGLAAERARALGYKVQMIVVGDDVALPDLPQPRGVAGTLFIHKIIGAMAANETNLDAVTSAAEQIARRVSSLGMSLDTCSVPGTPKEDRIKSGMAELGLGIHGEPGIEQVPFSTAEDAMARVVERLAQHVPAGQLVVLLNNLGGCTPLEMGILADALRQSQFGDRIQGMIGPAPIMTSLDMRGFSLSLFSPTDDDIAALKAPVAPVAWPGYHSTGLLSITPMPTIPSDPAPKASHDPTVHHIIDVCCNILLDSEADLNTLDAKSGDGDTGSTLATAAKSLLQKRSTMPLSDPATLFCSISREISIAMGGSSGVLMAIFFAAASESCSSGQTLRSSLIAGLKRMQEVGGARRGDRTMIDALEPALDAFDDGLKHAAEAARSGADSTASITRARAGRASYVSEDNLVGHNDPGAEAVARIFEGLAAT